MKEREHGVAYAPTMSSELAERLRRWHVLDMGTGCGVNAILAASKSSDVVAVDLNSIAVECARNNAIRNGVESRIDVFESDVFSKVRGAIDLIIFDPPFRWFRPRDVLEASIADENYRALTTFFTEAGERLKRGGRILLFFGTTGDVGYLDALVDRFGFERGVVATRGLVKDGLEVEYFVYRLER